MQSIYKWVSNVFELYISSPVYQDIKKFNFYVRQNKRDPRAKYNLTEFFACTGHIQNCYA